MMIRPSPPAEFTVKSTGMKVTGLACFESSWVVRGDHNQLYSFRPDELEEANGEPSLRRGDLVTVVGFPARMRLTALSPAHNRATVWTMDGVERFEVRLSDCKAVGGPKTCPGHRLQHGGKTCIVCGVSIDAIVNSEEPYTILPLMTIPSPERPKWVEEVRDAIEKTPNAILKVVLENDDGPPYTRMLSKKEFLEAFGYPT